VDISSELQMLRRADPGAILPGIDTQVGNPLSAAQLAAASTVNQSGVGYDPTHHRVVVTKNGAVLNGVNFGGLTVEIRANNVKIENSDFSAPIGSAGIQVDGGFSGTVVTNNTFDSHLVPANAGWIWSQGQITVTDNKFIDSPGDGVDLGSGVVSGNYFEGVGNASGGQHADAIWVTNSQGPVTISNNFIDWVADGTESYVNNTVRITTEEGSVNNVTVTGNYLLGGSYTISAGVGTNGSNIYSNINMDNNYIGFGLYGAFYPGAESGVTQSGNTIIDFTNPIYSTRAWAAYRAAGIPTTRCVTSTGATISNTLATPATLYGAGYRVHLYGGLGETNFVGGFGRQYLMDGPGAAIFTELAVSDATVNSADYIAAFNPAKDVIDLSHIDANLAAAGVQKFTFIGTAPFSGAGAQVRYVQDPAINMTFVEADLAGDSTPDLSIQITGMQTLTAANFALTGAQSRADLADGAALSVSTIRSASSPTEYSYTNVIGKPYSSFESIYATCMILSANDLDFSSTANELDLLSNGLTISRGSGTEGITVGTSAFSLGYHTNETIDVSASGADAFAFGANFGSETINGFTASGANADTINLALSSFSYLNSGMTQTQDLAAVLANATTSASGTTIHDSKGDNLTLTGFTASMIIAAASHFHFA
jgi:Peptidase M10 serralysin C terminal